MEYLLYLGAVALIAVGLVGIVVPMIPGIPLIFLGGWLIGWASDYQVIGVTGIVVLALLTAVGLGIDFLGQVLGAKAAGASKAGIWGAVIGLVIGLATGIWGIVFFPLVGAMAGEIYAGSSFLKAGAVGLSTWVAMVVGAALKIAIAFVMIGIIASGAIAEAVSEFASSEAASVAAVVPQAPNGAAPLEGHPGTAAEKGRIVLVPQSRYAKPKPSPEASGGAVEAAPTDAAPVKAEPDTGAEPEKKAAAEPAPEAKPAPEPKFAPESKPVEGVKI